jgi:hypothetical protein
LLLAVIASGGLLPATAMGQGERARDWETGFHVAAHSSLALFGFGGASMQVDNSFAYGFSGAYNFTDRLALGTDLSWSQPDYRARIVPDGPTSVQIINATMDMARIHVKGIFYFLDSNLSPFIEVGYGWTRIDSNIVEGPGPTECWWDPWWGYICQRTYRTFTETKPTYGGAFGIRWDTRTEVSLRGSIGSLKIDRGLAVDDSSMDTTQVEVLWRF